MIIVGVIGALILALLALALAAVTAWSGWCAAAELRQGFRSRPPGAADLALAVAGVALPVLLLIAFATLLAVELVGLVV